MKIFFFRPPHTDCCSLLCFFFLCSFSLSVFFLCVYSLAECVIYSFDMCAFYFLYLSPSLSLSLYINLIRVLFCCVFARKSLLMCIHLHIDRMTADFVFLFLRSFFSWIAAVAAAAVCVLSSLCVYISI